MEKAIKMLKESTSMFDKMKKHILYDQPDFGFLETVENKIRDLFKVKLQKIRSKTKKRERGRERERERERERHPN